MNISSLIKGTLTAAVLGVTFFLAGCGQQPLPPQIVELGCPVQSDVEMQRIFSGVNGVDDYSRPLNDHGVPVDTNGNCLATAPVPQVYMAPVSSAYVGILYSRYHYTYIYTPSLVHVYVGPGVVYRSGFAPTGRVTYTTRVPAGSTYHTATVRPSAAVTVRPGAANTSTFTPRAPAPGASSAFTRSAPSTFTPRAASPSSFSSFSRSSR